MRYSHPSPEEEFIAREDFQEIVNRSGDQWDKLEAVFFKGYELNMWLRRQRGQSIRSLAMEHHMSRSNVRDALRKIEKKLFLLREFFSL